MNPLPLPPVHGLFYPFHLCHEKTLNRLLSDYDTAHFKDFLSIQLTPMVGTTAFGDRMGDYYPQFLTSGQIVQGHSVSGPLSSSITHMIDEDLVDSEWRKTFHRSLERDRRFQEGLFGLSKDPGIRKDSKTGLECINNLIQDMWKAHAFSVRSIQHLSKTTPTRGTLCEFDYGFSLLKTSASLAYTYQLACQFNLQPVTDSFSHFLLLQQTFRRKGYRVENKYLFRQDY